MAPVRVIVEVLWAPSDGQIGRHDRAGTCSNHDIGPRKIDATIVEGLEYARVVRHSNQPATAENETECRHDLEPILATLVGVSPRVDVSMSAEEVHRFLNVSTVAVLTTLGPDGWPHSTGMWYVLDDNTLRMWTYAKSQKARNLMRDDRCAVLVESGDKYEELKGVLIQTHAVLSDRFDDVVGIGRGLYERYTQPRTGIAYGAGPGREIERQAHKRIGIVLALTSLASWDHGKLSQERRQK